MRNLYDIMRIRKVYQPGTRVRLLKMDDPKAPPFGTEGTVLGVDDIGSILVSWDTGSRLNVLLDKDAIEIISVGNKV